MILDEVQRVPDLFPYLQGFLDEERGGPFGLTGSQHLLLSKSISQSLAGRTAILELLPLSLAEATGRPALGPDQISDPTALGEAALLDFGTRRVPVDAKTGETVLREAFRNLDHYLSLSGDDTGVLVYGGPESFPGGRHVVRSWWHLAGEGPDA